MKDGVADRSGLAMGEEAKESSRESQHDGAGSMDHAFRARFLRFVLVGGTSFLLNLFVLWLGTGLLDLHYQISVVTAFLAVNLFGFIVNRTWSFSATKDHPLGQAGRYYSVMLCSLLASMLRMHLLVEIAGLNYLLANLLAAAVLLVGTFTAHALWTFRQPSTQPCSLVCISNIHEISARCNRAPAPFST